MSRLSLKDRISRHSLKDQRNGGNMTFIARFVHIKQVKGKIKFGQKNAISYTDGTQDGNGSN